MKNAKTLAACLLLLVFADAQAADKLVTVCRQADCFVHGWETSSNAGYRLDTECKGASCRAIGWHSVAMDGSTYDVSCKPGGCFAEGWLSEQRIGEKVLRDEVTCKGGSCLEHGWKVATGYDQFGGDVTCRRSDCSRFGGFSFWRGHFSQTSCHEGDCYRNGWDLEIF